MYKIDYVTIPRLFPRKFIELPPIAEGNVDEYYDKICNEVENMLKIKRSVLIICQTIRDTRIIYEHISYLGPRNGLILYNLDSNELDTHDLKTECVIISTNLAGRGTDFKISKQLNENGGLHVIVTFMPENTRIEEQAFGRSARGNCNGSGRLIVNKSGTTAQLKQTRNQNELKRLDQVAEYYRNFIQIEENFFEKFQEKYKSLKQRGRSSLYLKNFRVQWILWLDKNSILLEDPKKRQDVNRSFDTFLKEKEELHPVIRIELFKEQDLKGEFISAKQVLNDNFQDDSFAYQYFKAYEIIKENQLSGCSVRDLFSSEKKQLEKCLKMVKAWKSSRRHFIEIVNNLKQSYEPDTPALECFKEQQKEIIEVIDIFESSIKMMLGMDIVPDVFMSVIENGVLRKLTFDALIDQGCITPPKVERNIDDNEIKMMAAKHKINFTELKQFLKKHEQKEIKSLNDFGQEIKNTFKFPSRTEFWTKLLELQILTDEIKYATIDIEAIDNIDPSAGEIFKKFQRVMLSSASHLQVFFNPIEVDQNKMVTVKMDSIKSEFTQERIQFLMENDIIYFNMEASFNVEKFKSVKVNKVFDDFDETCFNDFSRICNDYEKIVQKLELRKILFSKYDKTYALDYEEYITFLNPDELGYDSVYYSQIYEVIELKFAYRIAFEKLGSTVIRKKSDHLIELDPNPHNSLLYDLIASSMIKHAKAIEGRSFNPQIYFTKSKIDDLLRNAGIDPTDQKSQKTIQLMLKEMNTVRNLGEKITKTLEKLTAPLNDRKKFKNPEVFLDPIERQLPTNKNIDVIQQKGLTHVINVREQKNEENWIKKFMRCLFFCIKIVLFFVIAFLYVVAILGLLVLEALLANFFISVGLYFGIKIAFSWMFLDIIVPLIGTFFIYCSYRLLEYMYTYFTSSRLSSDAVEKSSNECNYVREEPNDEYPNDPDEEIKDKFNSLKNSLPSDWITSLLNSLLNHVKKLIFDIGQKILNFITSNFPIIATLIGTLFMVLKNAKVVIEIASGIMTTLTGLIEKFCKKLSSILINKFNDMSNDLLQNIDESLSNLKIDDKTIEEFIKEYYDAVSERFKMTINEKKENMPAGQSNEDESIYDKEKEAIRKTILDDLIKNVLSTYDECNESEISDPVIQHAKKKATEMMEKQIDEKMEQLKPPKQLNNAKPNIHYFSSLADSQMEDIDEIFQKEFLSKAENVIYTTNDADVYADVIQHNVPMDMIGINAARIALEVVFGNSFKIIVSYNGYQLVFGDSEDEDVKVINIDLVEGHFINTVQSNKSSCDNNCLFYAIMDHFPEMRNISTEKWRKIVARVVRSNQDIREMIESRAHTYNRTEGFVGGNIGQNPKGNQFQRNQQRNQRQLRLNSHFVGVHRHVSREIRLVQHLLPRMEVNHMLTYYAWQEFIDWSLIHDPNNRILQALRPFLNANGRLIRDRLLSMPLIYCIHRSLASTLSRTFREDQRDHLINGDIHLAYKMDIGDQQNTMIRMHREFGHTRGFQGRSLENELEDFHEMCRELIHLAFLLGLLEEWQMEYLMNYINTLKYDFDYEIKEMYEHDLVPPKDEDFI